MVSLHDDLVDHAGQQLLELLQCPLRRGAEEGRPQLCEEVVGRGGRGGEAASGLDLGTTSDGEASGDGGELTEDGEVAVLREHAQTCSRQDVSRVLRVCRGKQRVTLPVEDQG